MGPILFKISLVKIVAKVGFGGQSGLGPGPGWGPYGSIWAIMGTYGPLWAHMGPYVSSWTDLGRSGHVRLPTFGRILHVLGSKLGF